MEGIDQAKDELENFSTITKDKTTDSLVQGLEDQISRYVDYQAQLNDKLNKLVGKSPMTKDDKNPEKQEKPQNFTDKIYRLTEDLTETNVQMEANITTLNNYI